MTTITEIFRPGHELRCLGCQMCIGSFDDPDCVIRIELADDGERMTPACCPATSMVVAA